MLLVVPFSPPSSSVFPTTLPSSLLLCQAYHANNNTKPTVNFIHPTTTLDMHRPVRNKSSAELSLHTQTWKYNLALAMQFRPCKIPKNSSSHLTNNHITWSNDSFRLAQKHAQYKYLLSSEQKGNQFNIIHECLFCVPNFCV